MEVGKKGRAGWGQNGRQVKGRWMMSCCRAKGTCAAGPAVILCDRQVARVTVAFWGLIAALLGQKKNSKHCNMCADLSPTPSKAPATQANMKRFQADLLACGSSIFSCSWAKQALGPAQYVCTHNTTSHVKHSHTRLTPQLPLIHPLPHSPLPSAFARMRANRSASSFATAGACTGVAPATPPGVRLRPAAPPAPPAGNTLLGVLTVPCAWWRERETCGGLSGASVASVHQWPPQALGTHLRNLFLQTVSGCCPSVQDAFLSGPPCSQALCYTWHLAQRCAPSTCVCTCKHASSLLTEALPMRGNAKPPPWGVLGLAVDVTSSPAPCPPALPLAPPAPPPPPPVDPEDDAAPVEAVTAAARCLRAPTSSLPKGEAGLFQAWEGQAVQMGERWLI